MTVCSQGLALHRGARARGFTLLEIMVALTILATIMTIIYGSFNQSFRVREHTAKVYDRYRDVRQAMFRMAREISSAYISTHHNRQDPTTATCFEGESDELTFSSMAHLRLVRDADESDQMQVGYFLKSGEASDGRRVTNLMRRMDPTPDTRVDRGGRVQILAEDVAELKFEYWEPSKEIGDEAWVDEWAVGACKAGEEPSADDKTELPERVRITLVVNGVDGKGKLKFVIQTPIMMREALDF